MGQWLNVLVRQSKIKPYLLKLTEKEMPVGEIPGKIGLVQGSKVWCHFKNVWGLTLLCEMNGFLPGQKNLPKSEKSRSKLDLPLGQWSCYL